MKSAWVAARGGELAHSLIYVRPNVSRALAPIENEL